MNSSSCISAQAGSSKLLADAAQPPSKKKKDNATSASFSLETSSSHDVQNTLLNEQKAQEGFYQDKDDLDDEQNDMNSSEAPRRLRRAETVLQQRTGRFILILDNVLESFSQQAMIRTAESLGVQYIYSIRSGHNGRNRRRMCKSVMKGSKSWVTVRVFNSAAECLEHLRNDGVELWSLVDSELGFERFDALEANDEGECDANSRPFIPPMVPLPLEPIFFASHAYWNAADDKIVNEVTKHVHHPHSYVKQSIIDYHSKKKESVLKNSLFEEYTAASSIPKRDRGAFSTISAGLGVGIRVPPKTSIYGFPSRVGIIIGNELGQVNSILTRAADRYIFMPSHGFVREGFTPSVRLAVLLDRLFMLCPEACGDLTDDQKILVRESWFQNLAKTPTQREQFASWLPRWKEIKPLQELRINQRKVPMLSKRLLKKLVILHNAAETHGLSQMENCTNSGNQLMLDE